MSLDLQGGRPASVAAPAGLAGVSSDALKRAAWESLVGDSGAWVMVVREDGVLVYANDALLRDHGVTAAQAIGRPVAAILPPTIASERLACYGRVIAERTPMIIEGIVGGAAVRCSVRPIPPEHAGQPAHVLCVSRRAMPDEPADPHPRYRAQSDDLGLRALLNERELEVLRLIGHGYTTAQIGKSMHRSVKTIEWHRVSLGAKLGVSNRVELARIAIRLGLASPFDGVRPTADGPQRLEPALQGAT